MNTENQNFLWSKSQIYQSIFELWNQKLTNQNQIDEPTLSYNEIISCLNGLAPDWPFEVTRNFIDY